MKSFNLSIFQFFNRNGGQLLIESIIAISIIIIGLLGLVGLLSRALSLNRVVSDQFTANYLAAEGIEVVKNIIDANIIQKQPWNLGLANGEYQVSYDSPKLESTLRQPLVFEEKTGRYSYGFGKPTSFVRVIKIELLSQDEIKVNSIVSWTTRGGGKFEVNAEDHFFNWR